MIALRPERARQFRFARNGVFFLPMIIRATAIAVLMTARGGAQDTTSAPPMFGPRDAWYAAGFATGAVALAPFDHRLALWFQQPSLQNNREVNRAASFFGWTGDPGAIIIGASLYGTGRLLGLNRNADLGLHGTESILIGGVITSAVKLTAGRARPYVTGDGDPDSFQLFRGLRKGNGYQAFPSGHTLAAFAAASSVTAETSRWWPASVWVIGPIMYGGATMVGVSRIYNDKHWASDVVIGAAVGTFSGIKVVTYHHTRPHNRLDRWLLSATPVAGPSGQVGLSVAY
jgi:membrane-associated phospholipid phosphatase